MPSPLATLALAALLALPTGATAADSGLVVSDPYVRLMPPGSPTTAAFMSISNRSGSDRRLLQAESPVARSVELHTHVDDHGVMRMRRVTAIEIPAGGHAELHSGGQHVMLIGLRQPLQDGERVPLTLRFDDGSSQQLAVPVRRAPAAHGRH
ncbi:copper chaperone PCu(A)C [Accumulibacter sp.]|uniref:copper chaperone PCu(A)C n=1 Tax=Accumulibacter sp. TaxID=2053492 RepID=UPI0025D877A0|nr:copper chaperone PCu(A)C [Accumulibacter sp.]MCM8612767.1 copper chaperone PCu(A)C [Accumulibacter sp.]MCM8637583.1 copper chaperone PCu(A)C [Accumulibacter sp.]MCM8639700.1 copper chaperone PCu(A)C [Accumulibacter sp.]